MSELLEGEDGCGAGSLMVREESVALVAAAEELESLTGLSGSVSAL